MFVHGRASHMNLVTVKNIYEGSGKNMKMLVPKGTKGKVVDKYSWGPHRYIVVQFTNKETMEFGDESHPLISYKRFIESS